MSSFKTLTGGSRRRRNNDEACRSDEIERQVCMKMVVDTLHLHLIN